MVYIFGQGAHGDERISASVRVVRETRAFFQRGAALGMVGRQTVKTQYRSFAGACLAPAQAGCIDAVLLRWCGRKSCEFRRFF